MKGADHARASRHFTNCQMAAYVRASMDGITRGVQRGRDDRNNLSTEIESSPRTPTINAESRKDSERETFRPELKSLKLNDTPNAIRGKRRYEEKTGSNL